MTRTYTDDAATTATVPDDPAAPAPTAPRLAARMVPGSLADLPDLIRPEELAPIFRCGRSTIYDAIRRDELPSFPMGRRLFIPKAALLRALGVTQ